NFSALVRFCPRTPATAAPAPENPLPIAILPPDRSIRTFNITSLWARSAVLQAHRSALRARRSELQARRSALWINRSGLQARGKALQARKRSRQVRGPVRHGRSADLQARGSPLRVSDTPEDLHSEYASPYGTPRR